jgi:hypothetical protein
MINTRILVVGCAVLGCGLLLYISGAAAPSPTEKQSKTETSAEAKALAAKKAQSVQLLFVQNASGLSSTEGKITLHDVEAMTVCFSDRPMRLAGHMLTKNFVPMWSEGQNSFLKDPPNATLSILQGKDVTSTVVTLRNPQLSGNDLTYDVTLLEGSLPENAGPCSLFIDIIGCPLTPMSFAGAARRGAFFRGAYYAGGYNGPALYDTSGSIRGPNGSAAWRNGSGTATGWRGNTITWHRD